MVTSINKDILNIPIYYTKKITEKIKEDKSVVNLARGDSEFQTPMPIIDYLREILPHPGDNLDDINSQFGKYTHYEKGKGSIELRKAIADKYYRESNMVIDIDNILITQGGMNAIFTTFLSITEPGDEILIPDPCYVAYDPIANYLLSGRKGIRIKLEEKNDFVLTIDQLNKFKTDRTKALILTSPLNPTGTLYSENDLKKIMEWGVQNNIYIIHDENHEKEIYDGNIHYPIMLFDEGKEHSILLNSFSRLGMGGWRLGWVIGPKKFMEAAQLAHSYINMTCNTFVQEAGAYTLKNYNELGFNEYFKKYQDKRDLLVPALNKLDGFTCKLPKSTCYVFPNIKDFYEKNCEKVMNYLRNYCTQQMKDFPQNKDKIETELHLINNSKSYAVYLFILLVAKVGTIPGIAYGSGSDDYIRLSFSVKKEAVIEGIKRLNNMYQSL
ncbi:pyridoxal phosphate-dependent aminotransferase [Wukongibacter sp. M2B1]|uniref:pyridoxal phosphate-dependent aminotransferase n=1 Tax=Wukongibacter sp. M2B1 TaxID=3088895 RepID=UPI003D7A3BF9